MYLNILLLVYGDGEAMWFDHTTIEIGIDGTLNVMRKLEMLRIDFLI